MDDIFAFQFHIVSFASLHADYYIISPSLMSFIPDVLDAGSITDVIEVTDENAIEMARSLSAIQGLLVGISSGANIYAALKMAEKYGRDKVIADTKNKIAKDQVIETR